MSRAHVKGLSCLFALLVAVGCCWSVVPAWADEPAADTVTDVTVSELASVVEELDETTVRVSGEAIGDVLRSETSGYVWVNIADEKATVGIFMTADMASQIENYGAYGVTGSTIEVVGTYHMACNEGHAGTLDVHADSVTVLDPGSQHQVTTGDRQNWIVAIALVLIAVVMLLIRRSRER